MVLTCPEDLELARSGPLESLGMEKMRQTAPMETVGCTIDGSQEAKNGNPGLCLSPKEE